MTTSAALPLASRVAVEKSPVRHAGSPTLRVLVTPSCCDQVIQIVKEERLVLADRPADGAAEIIAAQRRQRVDAPARGVELVVAQKLVDVAVELVGAAAGDRVDHAAVGVAELGAEAIHLDLELLHGFDRRRQLDAVGAESAAGVVDAIHQRLRGLQAAAADGYQAGAGCRRPAPG